MSIFGLIIGVAIVWPIAEYASDRIKVSRVHDVAAVEDATYQEECGSCHFAYQPGLLPKRSWQRLLTAEALHEHFGEPADLEETTRQHILNFALAHAADTSDFKRSQKIMQSLAANEAPLRISEVPYIKQKHDKIPAHIKQSNKIKSMSHCDTCHQRIAIGVLDDATVRIPQ